MKAFALFAAILLTAFSSSAAPTTLEDFSPHLSTNAQIIWKVPTNNLPNSFWIYRRLGPRIFPTAVISHAMVLASLPSKGFSQPFTNDFFISEDKGANYPGPRLCIFSIRPKSATISYTMPHSDMGSGEGVPGDTTIVMRAWDAAFQLGVDSKEIMFKNFTSHFCGSDEKGRDVTNQFCGRGVFLSRQLDGILFMGSGNDGWNEGFWIELGSYGQIRSFSLNWPDLKRYEIHQTATPKQIINCIRARKIIVLPNGDEEKYFEKIKSLANAKKFTVTKITPYYGEGIFGETPTNDVPSEFVTPFSELEVVADFGNSNTTVRIFSPILSSEVIRLLGTK